MLLFPTAPFPTTTTLIAVSISSTILLEGEQCSWISSQHQMCFRVKCFVVDKDRPRYVMIKWSRAYVSVCVIVVLQHVSYKFSPVHFTRLVYNTHLFNALSLRHTSLIKEAEFFGHGDFLSLV